MSIQSSGVLVSNSNTPSEEVLSKSLIANEHSVMIAKTVESASFFPVGYIFFKTFGQWSLSKKVNRIISGEI